MWLNACAVGKLEFFRSYVYCLTISKSLQTCKDRLQFKARSTVSFRAAGFLCEDKDKDEDEDEAGNDGGVGPLGAAMEQNDSRHGVGATSASSSLLRDGRGTAVVGDSLYVPSEHRNPTGLLLLLCCCIVTPFAFVCVCVFQINNNNPRSRRPLSFFGNLRSRQQRQTKPRGGKQQQQQ